MATTTGRSKHDSNDDGTGQDGRRRRGGHKNERNILYNGRSPSNSLRFSITHRLQFSSEANIYPSARQ